MARVRQKFAVQRYFKADFQACFSGLTFHSANDNGWSEAIMQRFMQRLMPRFMLAWLRALAQCGAWGLLSLFFWCAPLRAATYSDASIDFNWIDASTHTKVGYNTLPYKFNGLSGCGTTPPVIDDTISDAIPIGFSFMYAGVGFTTLRIMSNGRVQFNGNTTCGFGSPVQQLAYPDSSLTYTMRIYGVDLDPTLKSDVTASNYNTNCLSRITCYVSFATIGTVPNRSFVVTWNNVPEWTTGNNPAGAYNLQLILQENGEFIYQYGVNTPGVSTKTGQVGWEVDTKDYDTPQTGLPLNNSAIKFSIPQPVAEYHMEQTSWSSAAGQVIDTTGNARNGSALGLAQTIANGRVCRAANIPLNTSTGTIDAINSGISIPNVVTGAGTITFWYRANTAWSTGARDAQLLDATLVNNQWFFLTRRSNGHLRFVITDSTGAVQAVETATINVAAATWKHIAVSWNFNALGAANSDHMRIYVDGVLQQEQTFTTSGTVSSQIGTLYIGDNRSGITGSSGTGNSADGAIDEVRIYNYEGGLALVQRDQSSAQAGCLNHYAVSNAGTGSTCQQTTVTVTAHDVNHANFVLPNNTTAIRLSTTSGLGDWSLISGYGMLTNGAANSGGATYLFNGEYQAVFGLTYGTAGTVNINVTDGQFTESEDPQLTISACVTSRFNACEVAAARCVPSSASTSYAKLYTKLANTAFKFDLVKLKVDGTLETTFNGSATVDILANSTTGVMLGANNCPVSQTAVIPVGSVTFASGYSPSVGVSVPNTAFSAVTPNYSAYKDARVRITCSAASCGTAVTSCSTDNFAVRPTDFAVSSNMTNTALTDANGASTRLNAGAAFTLTATAVAGYNGTPFINNAIAMQKVVTHNGSSDYTDRLSNAAGISPIPIGAATISSGAVSSNTIKYDDFGNFRILAGGVYDTTFSSVDQPGDCVANSSSNSADSTGKFGCNVGNQSNTALFGRFYPDHYDVSGTLTAACNGFTYMSQPELGVSFAATAYSSNNLPLLRYSGVGTGTSGSPIYAGLSLDGENNAAVLSNRLTPTLAGAYTWSGGVAGRSYTSDAAGYAAGQTMIHVLGVGTIADNSVVRFSGDSTKYTVVGGLTMPGTLTITPGLQVALPAVATSVTVLHSFDRAVAGKDGPYDALGVRLTITDYDGAKVTSLNGVPITAATSALFGNTSVRYGRMHINNAYGSELLALPVNLTAQYWNGVSYATNVLDNCTSLVRANFTIPVAAPPNGYLGGLSAVNVSAANIPADSGLVTAGVGTIRMPVATQPIIAKGSYLLNSAIPYLPGSGRETLGVYKNGPTIFIREVY
jgi:hypothetical protein